MLSGRRYSCIVEICDRKSLIATGTSANAIDWAVKSGQISAPFRGVYGPSGPLPRRELIKAALMTQPPGTLVSHRTAAALHGFPWIPDAWSEVDAPVDLTVAVTDGRRQRAGLRIRRSTLCDHPTTTVDGMQITSPPRTLIDLVRERDVSRFQGLQLLDGAVRFGHCTIAQLNEEVTRATGTRRVRSARQLVALARDGVDSPQESRLRLILIDGGIRPTDPTSVNLVRSRRARDRGERVA